METFSDLIFRKKFGDIGIWVCFFVAFNHIWRLEVKSISEKKKIVYF